MTPGIFVGAVSDETGVELSVVTELHRQLRQYGEMKNTGRGRSDRHVDMEEAAMLLLALCVKACGCSGMRACNVARDHENGLMNRMLMAMQGGNDFRYDWAEPTGDLTVGATISGRALKAISEAGRFFKEEA